MMHSDVVINLIGREYETMNFKFEDVNIVEVVNQVHDADIGIIANYMFGLPTDTKETMEKTLQLS